MSGAAKGRAAAPAAGAHRGDRHPPGAAGPSPPPALRCPAGSARPRPAPAATCRRLQLGAGLRFPARQIPRRLQPEEPPPPPAPSGEEGGGRLSAPAASPARPGQVRPAAGEAAQPRGRELGFSPFPPSGSSTGEGKPRRAAAVRGPDTQRRCMRFN